MQNSFGSLLRKYREERQLSLGRLRDKLRDESYEVKSNGTVSKWESGIHKPSPAKVDALEEILGTPSGLLLEAAGYSFEAENKKSCEIGAVPQTVDKGDMSNRTRASDTETIKLTRDYDRKIFNESDSILSERDVRKIVGTLLNSNSFHDDMRSKWLKFLSFFDLEGNKYMTKELRIQFEKMLDSMGKLDAFIGEHFYDSESNIPKVELWIPGHWRFKSEWDDKTREKYCQLEAELHPLVQSVEAAYKSYRVAIRELLFE